MYSCKVLADSVNPHGIRLITLEVSYPRIIHAEFMTHRVFSRNAASNRAIPLSKTLSIVESDPFIPIYWGKNQRGMVAGEEFNVQDTEALNVLWLDARDKMLEFVRKYEYLAVHKSIPNRLLEPWQWITVIVSSTEWANFFNLRIDDAAEPHIRRAAEMMWDAIYKPAYPPNELKPGEWHLPYITTADSVECVMKVAPLLYDVNNPSGTVPDIYSDIILAKISAARTARVSYLNHGGDRDLAEDVRMCDEKLIKPGHWSPLEHPAICMDDRNWRGNIRGFRQLRKFYPQENRHTYARS